MVLRLVFVLRITNYQSSEIVEYVSAIVQSCS